MFQDMPQGNRLPLRQLVLPHEDVAMDRPLSSPSTAARLREAVVCRGLAGR